jgi:hypothetical protein
MIVVDQANAGVISDQMRLLSTDCCPSLLRSARLLSKKDRKHDENSSSPQKMTSLARGAVSARSAKVLDDTANWKA